MLEVKYIEKGRVYDFKQIDHEMYLIARSYFRVGDLYYFRINEFNCITIAVEDVIHIAEL